MKNEDHSIISSPLPGWGEAGRGAESWHVPDPAGQFASAYVGMGNNPVSFTDLDGMWAVGTYGGYSRMLAAVGRELALMYQDYYDWIDMFSLHKGFIVDIVTIQYAGGTSKAKSLGGAAVKNQSEQGKGLPTDPPPSDTNTSDAFSAALLLAAAELQPGWAVAAWEPTIYGEIIMGTVTATLGILIFYDLNNLSYDRPNNYIPGPYDQASNNDFFPEGNGNDFFTWSIYIAAAAYLGQKIYKETHSYNSYSPPADNTLYIYPTPPRIITPDSNPYKP